MGRIGIINDGGSGMVVEQQNIVRLRRYLTTTPSYEILPGHCFHVKISQISASAYVTSFGMENFSSVKYSLEIFQIKTSTIIHVLRNMSWSFTHVELIITGKMEF